MSGGGHGEIFGIALAEAVKKFVAVHAVAAGKVLCFPPQTQEVHIFGRIDGGAPVGSFKPQTIPVGRVASVGHIRAVIKVDGRKLDAFLLGKNGSQFPRKVKSGTAETLQKFVNTVDSGAFKEKAPGSAPLYCLTDIDFFIVSSGDEDIFAETSDVKTIPCQSGRINFL